MVKSKGRLLWVQHNNNHIKGALYKCEYGLIISIVKFQQYKDKVRKYGDMTTPPHGEGSHEAIISSSKFPLSKSLLMRKYVSKIDSKCI